MSCAECRQIFASGLEGVDLQIAIDSEFPNFACEKCSISEYSPGRVQANEQVVFLTIHPIYYDEKTGVLSPIAFLQLTKSDLSVLRRRHATIAEFDDVRSKLASGGSKKVERSVEWCCVVQVSTIRKADDANGRTLGVYDTALEPLPSHASVFVRKDFFESTEKRLEARRLALSIFEPNLVRLDTIMIGGATAN